MRKSFIILSIFFFLFTGCQGTEKKSEIKSKELKENPISDTSSSQEESKIGRGNYAITWKWVSKDSKLIEDNTSIISKELTQLWKDDVVENAYYDTDAVVDKLDYFPNVAFFVKAHSKVEVRSILNALTIVKKGIAKYQIHPVGILWLDRKTDLINKKGVTKSYATVWTRQKEVDATAKNISQLQSKHIMKLWEEGVIENVYFDVDKEQQSNNKTDFVFFVNANTKEEAENICNALPYFKNGIATYELHQVGVFWMGKHEN